MVYREIMPPPALSGIVRYFWTIETPDTPLVPQRYRLLAESSPGLVFFYHHHAGVVAGISERHCEFTIPGKLGIVGAYLFPYCLPLLFKVSPAMFTNTQMDITDVLGTEGALLREQITGAASNTHRIRILIDYLLAKKNKAAYATTGFLNGVQHIVQCKGAVKLETLAQDTGLSHRQFDRRFLTAVGVAPKVFSRLVRFQSSLQLPKTGGIENLTHLALAAGYYDQSHFIREFKAYAGMSPKQYFSLQSQVADNFVRL